MDSIRTWAWMLCGGAVICGIFDFLLPSGNSKKAGKLAAGLVFLSCMVMPLKDGISMEFPQFSAEHEAVAEELQQEQEKLAYSIAESHILKLIRTALTERGFPAEKLEIILTEQYINVELIMPLSLQNREQEIRQVVQESCGAREIQIQWQEET